MRGADAYLTKPLDIKQLVALLSSLAAGAQTAAPAINRRRHRSPRQRARQRNANPGALLRACAGSIPTPGANTVYYGGNTTCVEVRADGQIIILDAGTGLRNLGRALSAEFENQPLTLTLLLTHTHWDHIQGLPFFPTVLSPSKSLAHSRV